MGQHTIESYLYLQFWIRFYPLSTIGFTDNNRIKLFTTIQIGVLATRDILLSIQNLIRDENKSDLNYFY